MCGSNLQSRTGTRCVWSAGAVDRAEVDTTLTTQHGKVEPHCTMGQEFCVHPVPWWTLVIDPEDAGCEFLRGARVMSRPRDNLCCLLCVRTLVVIQKKFILNNLLQLCAKSHEHIAENLNYEVQKTNRDINIQFS